MGSKREEFKMLAKIAEQVERFDEMKNHMKSTAEQFDEPLNEDERNLLSVAYKNVVGSRRTAWRRISETLTKEEDEKKKGWCSKMKKDIEGEVNKYCDDILQLLENKLIPKTDNDQAKIFYLKMKGDYYRYRVEICEPGDARNDLVTKSRSAYDAATDIADSKLPPASPVRLGLALNFSVFYYEVMGDATKACEMAKHAFENAIAELDGEDSDEAYKDSTLILQLLRDNLTLWRSEMEEQEDM